MKTRTKVIGAGAAVVALAIGIFAVTAWSQEAGHGFGPHPMRHGMARMMGHDMDRDMDHDMGPGMRRHGMGPGMMGHGMMGHGMMGQGMMGRGAMGHGGNAATATHVRDIHALLADHSRIKRTVTNLSDGIRTITESDDPAVAQTIKTHVADMMRRVEAGDNADLPMQTSKLHAIFRNKDKIATKWEATEKGVVVVQTSSDPETVAALQAHAADVTGLVQGGMRALHAAMMREVGPMHGAMGGRQGRGMTHRGGASSTPATPGESGHDHR
jgi:hypothetical protein